MSESDRPDQTANDGALADEKPACTALVAVVPTVHWTRVPDQQMSRAEFVTQLIATAEHLPQTRSLRRATPADAQAAYGGARRQQTQSAGVRTRQIV
jgi:hypothetical protein